MELSVYKDNYQQECLDRTNKGVSLTLLLSFVCIALFAMLDPSYFHLNYWTWRGIGLFFTGVAFLVSIIPSIRKKINVNYLFSLAYGGVLIMIDGVFIQTILIGDSSSSEKMAVTLGTISIYIGYYFFAFGAKKEFSYLTMVSGIPILAFTVFFYSSRDFGYLMTTLMMNLAISASLLRLDKHNKEKFMYHKHLEHNERELMKKQKELERMNEELRGFNHSISHDFKTPIRAANSFSQLLARDVNSKDYHRINQYVDFISDSMTKMNALLEALNTVSNISERDIEFSEIALEPVLNSAFEEVTYGSSKKIEFYIAEDLPSVIGDQSLLREVFTNILSNAMKYSHYQATTIINVGYFEENGNTVIFIKDNGIGFKMDYKDQLFKIFKRLHNEKEYEGTGVGLAIVKRIMGYHHGDVWASSVQGNGATFYLSFPKRISSRDAMGLVA